MLVNSIRIFAFPFTLPDSSASTILPLTVAPRSMTVSPLTTTGSATRAVNVSPVLFLPVEMGSFRKTVIAVPLGTVNVRGAAGFGASAGFAAVVFAAAGAAELDAFAAVLSAAAPVVALASGLVSFVQLTKANVIARTEITDRIFFIVFLSRKSASATAPH